VTIEGDPEFLPSDYADRIRSLSYRQDRARQASRHRFVCLDEGLDVEIGVWPIPQPKEERFLRRS
jgi:hypothetical protein